MFFHNFAIIRLVKRQFDILLNIKMKYSEAIKILLKKIKTSVKEVFSSVCNGFFSLLLYQMRGNWYLTKYL